MLAAEQVAAALGYRSNDGSLTTTPPESSAIGAA
jgi:hypothetical protein